MSIHMKQKVPENHPHGPENAEHELKKAYNSVIEASLVHFWDRKAIQGVNPYEVITLYRHAYDAYRRDDRLASERWARSAKHLSRAFWHEAKIAFLEPRVTELPFLENAEAEYSSTETYELTTDLLESVSHHAPPGFSEMPEDMRRYILRGKKHLTVTQEADYKNELLTVERIKAAHEYARVVECLGLAYEAESKKSKAA